LWWRNFFLKKGDCKASLIFSNNTFKYWVYGTFRMVLAEEKLPNSPIMTNVEISAHVANETYLIILEKLKSKEKAPMKASMIFTTNDIIINLGALVIGVLVHK
jgi:hypothetical protein